MKNVIIGSFMFVFSAVAFANGSGPNNQNNWDVITNNNYGDTVTNNRGGNAESSSIGVGIGGSVVGSGNSSSNSSVNNAVIVGGGTVSGKNEQSQGQTQSTNNANNATQSTTVNVGGDVHEAERIPASSAVAPTMFATAMCQTARSGAFQNAIFGISLGGTITDENCMRLEQFRVVTSVIRDDFVSHSMACIASPIYKQAMMGTDKQCSGSESTTKTFGQP